MYISMCICIHVYMYVCFILACPLSMFTVTDMYLQYQHFRRNSKREEEKKKGISPVYGQAPSLYGDALYARTIQPVSVPGYYPMGVSYSRRQPLIPEATSYSVSSMNNTMPPVVARQGVPVQQALRRAPLVLQPQAQPQPQQSKYLFYEDRDENAYGSVGQFSQFGGLRRGGPQMVQSKTAYFD